MNLVLHFRMLIALLIVYCDYQNKSYKHAIFRYPNGPSNKIQLAATMSVLLVTLPMHASSKH